MFLIIAKVTPPKKRVFQLVAVKNHRDCFVSRKTLHHGVVSKLGIQLTKLAPGGKKVHKLLVSHPHSLGKFHFYFSLFGVLDRTPEKNFMKSKFLIPSFHPQTYTNPNIDQDARPYALTLLLVLFYSYIYDIIGEI